MLLDNKLANNNNFGYNYMIVNRRLLLNKITYRIFILHMKCLFSIGALMYSGLVAANE